MEPPDGNSGEYGIARQYDPIARKFATVCKNKIHVINIFNNEHVFVQRGMILV